MLLAHIKREKYGFWVGLRDKVGENLGGMMLVILLYA